MTPTLTHHSARPLILDRARVYEQPTEMKPRGLWLSNDDADAFGWKAWCEGEDWNMGGFVHATDFTLAADANILTIGTMDELLAFTDEYGTPPPWGDSTTMEMTMFIEWPRVAADYDGILITPYIWAGRLDRRTFWYYGWDCASGCFWNLDALVPVEPERREVPVIPGGYTMTSERVA